MGLLRMWRRYGHREQSAQVQATESRERLADTQREVTELQRLTEQNKFADLLRQGIRRGYRPLEGGQ